jgi:hypothetical protein
MQFILPKDEGLEDGSGDMCWKFLYILIDGICTMDTITHWFALVI